MKRRGKERAVTPATVQPSQRGNQSRQANSTAKTSLVNMNMHHVSPLNAICFNLKFLEQRSNTERQKAREKREREIVTGCWFFRDFWQEAGGIKPDWSIIGFSLSCTYVLSPTAVFWHLYISNMSESHPDKVDRLCCQILFEIKLASVLRVRKLKSLLKCLLKDELVLS